MESIIKRIIDKKLNNHEIILEKNIISSLFLIDCTLFFEHDIELIEKNIKDSIKSHKRLIELSNGKYGDTELIKKLCSNLDDSEIRTTLEQEYFCNFEDINLNNICELLKEKEVSYTDTEVNSSLPSEIHEEKIKTENTDILTFDELIKFGLKNGYVTYNMLGSIDFEEEIDVFDISEAYAILDEKGIRIEEE